MKNNPKNPSAWSLWIPVTMAFLLVIAAWVITIRLAKNTPSDPIPLEQNSRTTQENP